MLAALVERFRHQHAYVAESVAGHADELRLTSRCACGETLVDDVTPAHLRALADELARAAWMAQSDALTLAALQQARAFRDAADG